MPSRGGGRVRHRSEPHPTVIQRHSDGVALGRGEVPDEVSIVPVVRKVPPLRDVFHEEVERPAEAVSPGRKPLKGQEVSRFRP